MKRAVCFTTAALSAAFAFGLWAQDMGGQDQPEQEMPKPGPHHDHMKAHEGTWEWTGEFDMGGNKAEGKGTQTNTIKGDGLWMVIDTTGDMGGSKFWGSGVAGYDLTRKKHVSSWVDSASDYVQVGEGDCADDCKTLTMWVNIKDMEDPTKMGKMKQVTQVVDKDHLTLTFSVVAPDGTEVEIGVITYARKK